MGFVNGLGPRFGGAFSFFGSILVCMHPLTKHSGIALGALAILGLVIWYMATNPAPRHTPPDVATTTPSGEERAYIRDAGTYYSIEAAYPTRTPLPNEGAVQAIKAYEIQVIAEFQTQVADNQTFIDKLVAAGEDVPASMQNLQLSIDYSTKSGAQTLTYILNVASYTGGAHGLEQPVTFTFDTVTGAKLAIGDLFLPDTEYLARLSSIARTDLPSIQGEYAYSDFITDGTEPLADNFSRFYLEGDTLYLLFPPYQVAPYVAGTVTLPVKLSRIAAILKPEYR